jgi:DNA polymerase (family X)
MMNNYELAEYFDLLSKLLDIHDEDTVKAKSYASAVFNIENATQPLVGLSLEQLKTLRGIGSSLATKIREIADTGSLAALQEIVERTPPGLLELLKVKGLGAKKIRTIWKELEITTPGELLYACNENRLSAYKGFGEKSQASIQAALEFFLSNKNQYLFVQIDEQLPEWKRQLQKIIPNEFIAPVGAAAAQDSVVDKIEWLTSTNQLTEIAQIVGGEIKEETNESFVWKKDQVEQTFYITQKQNFGTEQVVKTSSKEFLTAFNNHFGGLPTAATEKEFFEKASCPFIPAYHRLFPQAIDIYKNNQQSKIISPYDIKGIIHNHSTYSDGLATLQQMAEACIDKGYEYLVISDHSQYAAYAKGLKPDKILQQHDEIEKLNQQLHPFKIFKSIECDILPNGDLDYDDEILSSFDLVIASIHSNLQMTEDKAMERLLKAVFNKHTRILGHPTGRLLLSRPGYPVRFTELIEACAQYQVVLELNAHPSRLDVDYTLIPEIERHNVKLSINPDAHSVDGIDMVYYGSIAARKGLLKTVNNLSSFSLLEFEAWLKTKKH